MIHVFYNRGDCDLWCSNNFSKDEIIENFINLFPELNSQNTYIEERFNDGQLEWHIVTVKNKRQSNIVSYFSYILLNGTHYFIKDMDSQKVAKKILITKRGDYFNIKGLGMLRVVNIHYNPHHDKNETIKEIGLVCNRVDH